MIELLTLIKEELERQYPYIIDIGAKEDRLTGSLPAVLITPLRESSNINLLGHRKSSAVDFEVTLFEYHIPNQIVDEINLIDSVRDYILQNDRIKKLIVNAENVTFSYKILKDSSQDLNGTVALTLTFRMNLR